MNRLFFILLLLSTTAWGNQHPEYSAVYDLGNDWLYYDHNKNAYLPYTGTEGEGPFLFSFRFTPSDYPKAFLLINTSASQSDVFINNVMDEPLVKEEWSIYELDKLTVKYGDKPVVFSFLSDKGPEEFETFIGFPVKEQAFSGSVKSKRDDVVRIMPRDNMRYKSGLAFAFLIGLTIVSLVSNTYGRVFKKLISPVEVLSSNVKENLFLIGKPLNPPGIAMIVMTTVIIGIGIMLLDIGGLRLVDDSLFFRSADSMRVFVSNFVVTLIVVFTSFFVKYLFISLISSFFNIRDIVDAHYIKVLQVTITFAASFVMVLFIMYSLHIPLMENVNRVLLIMLISFFSIRLLLIYFTINKDGHVKFSYLFSYLCIVEVLPITVGLNFFF